MLTTLPPSCAVVTKSGNRNFLEPSGPVQACNGTALPLPLLYSSNLSKICVLIFTPLQFVHLFYNLSKFILLMYFISAAVILRCHITKQEGLVYCIVPLKIALNWSCGAQQLY
jgi:hypothetical protein